MDVEYTSVDDAYEWFRGQAKLRNLTRDQFETMFDNFSEDVQAALLAVAADGRESGKSRQEAWDRAAGDDYSAFLNDTEAEGLSGQIQELIKVLVAPTLVQRDDAGRITGTFKDVDREHSMTDVTNRSD